MSRWNGPLTDLRTTFENALAVLVLGTIVLGPPAYFVYRLWSGAPLIATRTVTKTQYYGVAFEAGGLLLVWIVVLTIGYGMATGLFPRRVR